MARPKVVAGGVDEYIAACPVGVQPKLESTRKAIKSVAPDAIETVSYFKMPGYSYQDKDYDYNGMFAWFSYKKPFIRVHVRPPVINDHAKELAEYKTSVGAVFFPEDIKIPAPLVRKLVKASLRIMKDMITGI